MQAHSLAPWPKMEPPKMELIPLEGNSAMKLKRKFIAVIGHADAGKSTIIQSLTGCKNRQFYGRVQDRDRRKWINVIATSPKENGRITRRKVVAMMRATATNSRYLGMVMALQPHKEKARGRLTIQEVFEMSSRYDFERHVFFILKPHKNGNRTAGIDANEVEKLIGDIEFKPPLQPLNARRFAHINASLIRDVVGWF
jgi:hypothetical protein